MDKSLLIGGKDFTLIGRPLLPRDAFQIMATVVEKNLSQHKICYRHLKRVKSNNPKTRCKLLYWRLVLYDFFGKQILQPFHLAEMQIYHTFSMF